MCQEKIGFVFQTFNLVPYLIALANVQIPLCLAGLEENDQISKTERFLNRVGFAWSTGLLSRMYRVRCCMW